MAASTKPDPEKVRIDRWLWSVRLFKTRSAATDACGKGRVTIKDEAGKDDTAKPARKLSGGEVIEVKRKDFTATYRVERLIEKRVGAGVAVECYTDLTPERPRKEKPDVPFYAVRERGQGRPTKRDRREIDRLRGRGGSGRPRSR